MLRKKSAKKKRRKKKRKKWKNLKLTACQIFTFKNYMKRPEKFRSAFVLINFYIAPKQLQCKASSMQHQHLLNKKINRTCFIFFALNFIFPNIMVKTPFIFAV